MQKIKMSRGTLLTFEEGCNKYLENCRQRNLRKGTINTLLNIMIICVIINYNLQSFIGGASENIF